MKPITKIIPILLLLSPRQAAATKNQRKKPRKRYPMKN